MSWNVLSPPPIFDGEDETELKRKWAQLTALHPDRIRTAGYQVFVGEHEHGRAMQAAAWAHDPFVHRIWEEMRASPDAGEDADYEYAENRLKTIIDDLSLSAEVRLKAIEQFRDMKGYTTKAKEAPNLINNGVINVLRVPVRDITPEDDADFERKFEAQQLKLVRDARSSRPN